MSERKAGARPIADAVKSWLHEKGLTERVDRASVIVDWRALVGRQIAGVTEPRTVTEDGTLFVGVRTSGWMQELSMMERQLLERINAREDRFLIRRIRWELLR